jgi:predicted acylesterase/phospholipase RssA
MVSSVDARSTTGRIGLALAGGGPGGALYELGALRALEESLDGIDFTDLVIYVGVSAGALIGACLANGINPRRLCRAMGKQDPGDHLFRKQDPGDHLFTKNIFFTPAINEYLRRGRTAPQLLATVIWSWLWPARDASLMMEAVVRLSEALPVGLFDNEPIRKWFEDMFSIEGRTDDFRLLKRRLVVVAADLDTGKARRFGEPGSDHIPISKAIQASTALPALYSPVLIEGRYYVDGILLKTMHASVPLDAEAELVICINPLVPINRDRALESADEATSGVPLIDRGLPMVLSQSLRTLIHSRLSVGMAAYAPRYPGQDVVLFEPRRDDYRMFFNNTLSFASRRAICEHAYYVTRRDLLLRFDELAPIFARHGLRLRRDVLEDQERNLWVSVGLAPSETTTVTENLDRVLRQLEAIVAQQDAPATDGVR